MVDGLSDWRLPWASVIAGAGPTTTVVNCATATEIACRDNEMGYMFYYNLGGNFGDNKTGTQTALGGQVLTGIQPVYWSGTEFDSDRAWNFNFFNGSNQRRRQGHRVVGVGCASGRCSRRAGTGEPAADRSRDAGAGMDAAQRAAALIIRSFG